MPLALGLAKMAIHTFPGGWVGVGGELEELKQRLALQLGFGLGLGKITRLIVATNVKC